MKIDPKTKLNVERVKRARKADPVQRGGDAPSEAKSGPHADRVAISEEVATLTEIVDKAPVDEVEFEELKRAIRAGEYKPDLESLAFRLQSELPLSGEDG